jgi:hypothetical protein
MDMNIRPILKRNGKIMDGEIELCQDIFTLIRPLPNFDHPNTSRIALALAEFAVIFRPDNGIQAMLDYINWAKASREEAGILPTIMHDKCMSPRTSGYLGVNDGDRAND